MAQTGINWLRRCTIPSYTEGVGAETPGQDRRRPSPTLRLDHAKPNGFARLAAEGDRTLARDPPNSHLRQTDSASPALAGEAPVERPGLLLSIGVCRLFLGSHLGRDAMLSWLWRLPRCHSGGNESLKFDGRLGESNWRIW